jgi:hypothetical protein
MPSIDVSGRAAEQKGLSASEPKPAHKRKNPRPQRLCTWFNLIPVKEFEDTTPAKILFLDSFVTVARRHDAGKPPYSVWFEGKYEMCVVVELGIIFVWHGEDLQKPDRSFPKLFETPYASEYVSSQATIFEDTHVMDFVENGSDNLHFKAVHLWEYSKIYDHKVSQETVTLKQDTRFRYGACSTRRSIRLISKILPQLILTQDYVYHGPCLAVVGARACTLSSASLRRAHTGLACTSRWPSTRRPFLGGRNASFTGSPASALFAICLLVSWRISSGTSSILTLLSGPTEST